jgi:sulfofructose kinase
MTGVEAHLFTTQECASQQSYILVDDSGERTVLWKRDERLTPRPEELQREWIVNALHVDGYDTKAATPAAGWAWIAGIPVISDLDEIYHHVKALVKKVDDLITSRDVPPDD